MVVRAGPLAMLSREPRQARKGAAVTVDACAGVWLVRAAALSSRQQLSIFDVANEIAQLAAFSLHALPQ